MPRKLSMFSGVFLLLSQISLALESPRQAAVATAHPLATQAALSILNDGGNAFDAAVAVSAVLAVVEPYGSGLGGGGFYLMHDAKSGNDTVLDARETAPLAAKKTMFLNKRGVFQPELARDGPLAAGIPAIPAALDHLSRRYGRLSLSQALAPAIALATSGFDVDERLLQMLRFRADVLRTYASSAETFFINGDLPAIGTKWAPKDLDKTLQLLAKHGRDGFYRGELAERMVAAVKAAGGVWQLRDLQEYRVIERKPLTGEYRGMRIISVPPPSSGGVVLIEMLNILADFDSADLTAAQRIHINIEAMRRAYRDRAQYLGDPDFTEIPLQRLLHPMYAAGLSAAIRFDQATPSASLPGYMGRSGVGEDTTHFSIVDKEGNSVAATLSINYPFGSGFVVPGSGVVLNNEMDDFSSGGPNLYGLVGGAANAIAPGKRMLSSMSPTFLIHQDRFAVLGTPGGSRIITMVMQAALAFYDGQSAQDMVRTPRYHHQFLPDYIEFEPEALTQDMQLELQLMNHKLKAKSNQYGNMQVVIWNQKTGVTEAASDPRGIGRADLGSYKVSDKSARSQN